MLLQALCSISYPLVNLNWSYSPETPNLGQTGDMLSRVTVKFDGWPWKTIGHLFYATSSFVQHFVAIRNSNWNYIPETSNLSQIRRFLEPCDLEIWRMTLKNSRAPLLWYLNLCASFHTHWRKFKLELQSGTPQPGSNSTIFRAVWPCNLTDDLQKQ